MDELTEALAATGATIAFDAIGGGKLAGQILSCMEAALNRNREGIQPLRLERRTSRSTSTAASTRPDRVRAQLRHGLGHGRLAAVPVPAEDRRGGRRRSCAPRVAAELKTTFASHYAREISLAEALRLEEIAVYNQRATGEKVLIEPHRG